MKRRSFNPVIDGQKKCAECEVIKPVSEFRKSPQPNGYVNICKECGNSKQREWVKRNPEKHRCTQLASKLVKYGIAADEYESIFEKQGGVCAICGLPNKGKRAFAIDHDHDTGAVRGLLCNTCNTGIGDFGEDVNLLAAAVSYLISGGVQ